ncbi:DUF2283 domain-containing protein [Streptomyces sp. NPDC005195]|uniref:DUF2283 domain-containing protein n=1 Tax=Streptomyces sp. NPDC005195 TaxID=3154561 RepID=UPI0033AFF441
MELSYDLDADAMYLHATDVPVARTVEVDSGTMVDVADDGSVVGIEIVTPARNWPIDRLLAEFDISAEATTLLRSLYQNASPEAFTASGSGSGSAVILPFRDVRTTNSGSVAVAL